MQSIVYVMVSEKLAEIIADDCERKADITLSVEEALAIATYIKEKIK